MSSKTGYIVITLICLCLGIGCLYYSISIINSPDSIEKGFILSNYTNPLIKFSPSFGLGFAALTLLSLPFLILKNFMSLGCNYWESSELVKAKQTLTCYLLFTPAIAFFVIAFCFSGIEVTNYPLFIIVMLGVIYTPAGGMYKYLKFRKKGT